MRRDSLTALQSELFSCQAKEAKVKLVSAQRMLFSKTHTRARGELSPSATNAQQEGEKICHAANRQMSACQWTRIRSTTNDEHSTWCTVGREQTELKNSKSFTPQVSRTSWDRDTMESGGEIEHGGLLNRNCAIDSFGLSDFFCASFLLRRQAVVGHLSSSVIRSHSCPHRLFSSSPVTINGLIRDYANDP